jgi:hypothetical protein
MILACQRRLLNQEIINEQLSSDIYRNDFQGILQVTRQLISPGNFSHLRRPFVGQDNAVVQGLARRQVGGTEQNNQQVANDAEVVIHSELS